jgi:hypothetical protein
MNDTLVSPNLRLKYVWNYVQKQAEVRLEVRLEISLKVSPAFYHPHIARMPRMRFAIKPLRGSGG